MMIRTTLACAASAALLMTVSAQAQTLNDLRQDACTPQQRDDLRYGLVAAAPCRRQTDQP